MSKTALPYVTADSSRWTREGDESDGMEEGDESDGVDEDGSTDVISVDMDSPSAGTKSEELLKSVFPFPISFVVYTFKDEDDS